MTLETGRAMIEDETWRSSGMLVRVHHAEASCVGDGKDGSSEMMSNGKEEWRGASYERKHPLEPR